LYPAVW